MNRNLLYLIISLFAVLALILTNPKEHKAAVKAKMSQIIQQTVLEENKRDNGVAEKLGLSLGALMGGYMVDRLIEGSITRTNYLLFSTTNFVSGDESTTIGLGILGSVYLSSKIDKKLKEVRKQQ
ncbi:hypothetical protein IC229_24375 [Spirosoma sp. BT702]|uniref:DUF4359 domain-containing protein n=1 Tax=Spirosoma profusum TaxID=2771354 RepID=A0A926Y4V9_9BACT|nr:hypothetical protein [Spirosoma profusum]MBD2703805.1 hypothetical protein [Spirosoma profusum]